jgi:hypothetical protein
VKVVHPPSTPGDPLPPLPTTPDILFVDVSKLPSTTISAALAEPTKDKPPARIARPARRFFVLILID